MVLRFLLHFCVYGKSQISFRSQGCDGRQNDKCFLLQLGHNDTSAHEGLCPDHHATLYQFSGDALCPLMVLNTFLQNTLCLENAGNEEVQFRPGLRISG